MSITGYFNFEPFSNMSIYTFPSIVYAAEESVKYCLLIINNIACRIGLFRIGKNDSIGHLMIKFENTALCRFIKAGIASYGILTILRRSLNNCSSVCVNFRTQWICA